MSLTTNQEPGTRKPCGFIFDWDGVVIDSHAAHEESWRRLFGELGRSMPPDFFKKTFGMRNEQIIPAWFPDAAAGDAVITRLGDRKEELYRGILRQTGIAPLPGVAELLRELRAQGIPCAVGSSTPRKNIDTIMNMSGLETSFDVVISAEDVTIGKPDPQVFLKAAQRLQRLPENCIVIEDAHVGIEAGKRAGMKVVAVATTHPAASLQNADAVFESLNGVTVRQIMSVVGIQK